VIDQDQHIRDLAANWPTLSREQKDKLRILLRGDILPSGPYVPTPAEIERERKAKEQAARLKKAEDLAAAMVACDVCDLPPVAHHVQDRYYGGYHEWQPGRAEKLMKRGVKA